jgi:hypothetical protein
MHSHAKLSLYKPISPRDFAALGLEHIAYVKPILVEGARAFAVHAADGTQIAVLASREVAAAAVQQHDLEPVSVH